MKIHATRLERADALRPGLIVADAKARRHLKIDEVTTTLAEVAIKGFYTDAVAGRRAVITCTPPTLLTVVADQADARVVVAAIYDAFQRAEHVEEILTFTYDSAGVLNIVIDGFDLVLEA